MNIFRSIRWRLQIWYGLILVGVLLGFGVTAYQMEWGRQMRNVDDGLRRRYAMLAGAMHFGPPGMNGGFPPGPGFPGRPPGDFPPHNQPGDFHLPERLAGMFDTNDPGGYYFIIRQYKGRELARGGPVPALQDMAGHAQMAGDLDWQVNQLPELQSSNPPPVLTLNRYRETLDFSPNHEEMILVGRSIAPEIKELNRTAWNLAGIGCIILLLGLGGGWWISSRAIRPIENINAAAVKISAGDLTQRINISETESELGQLAATLNATFARLEAAFAQQKQFASDAAHELRTPVSVILTQTQTALKREREAADYKQTIEACQRAAERMRRLISALLELTRLDAGQESIQRVRFDFAKTVAECVELIRPLAVERRVEIRPEIAAVEIDGDASRLGQVVTNLLTNAIQYNHEGGEVRVKLEARNGFAVLTVADNGAGIPPGDIARIFDRFYRADKSRTGANAGLGLAISKAIVESHGGAIEAASGQGGGATFTVRLQMAWTEMTEIVQRGLRLA